MDQSSFNVDTGKLATLAIMGSKCKSGVVYCYRLQGIGFNSHIFLMLKLLINFLSVKALSKNFKFILIYVEYLLNWKTLYCERFYILKQK